MSIVTRFARGGSERRLLDVIGALEGADHLVVVGGGSDPRRVETDLAGCEVHWCGDLRREISPVNDVMALGLLVRWLRGWDPGLVVTHQSKAGQLGRVAARLAGTPVVHSASMASFGPGYPSAQDRLYRWVERATAPLVDQYACVGHDLARRLIDAGIPADRIEVVRSSIDPRHLDRVTGSGDPAELRRRLGLSADGLLVGYVGSLEERKGVRQFPEILGRLRSERPDVGLVIAGDGPLASELDALFRGAGLDSGVDMLGHTDDVGAVMRAIDVLVLPSAAEGLPQVLVQAISWGTPFVAYDVDGVEELLGLGVAGDVVPLGDSNGVALAVLRLAGRSSTGVHAVAAADLDEWRPEVVRARYGSLMSRWIGESNEPSGRNGERRV